LGPHHARPRTVVALDFGYASASSPALTLSRNIRQAEPGANFAHRRTGAILTAMDAASLLARIASEPGKMGGKHVIRGRRITPAMVLTMLANGATREAVLEAYPVLEPADIDACLLYAARLSEAAAAEGLTIVAE
jgi:uncharacterized protein (DUF433 family)